MGQEEVGDKTSIVSGDTLSGRLKVVDETPPTLVVLIGPTGYVGKQWPLIENEYMIGRAIESNIFVDDRSVSRSHAKIEVKGSLLSITDLGSANKTVVNGQTLNPMVSQQLKDNDQIKTGNVIFKFLERGNLEAITNQQLVEKAAKDALTGAYSKGALIEKGPEAVKRAETLVEELSILTFDIDHFKKINDQFGHPAGDYVLKELSAVIMKKLVRSNDFFARYGGEEFVIILSGSPAKAAAEVAERVRATIESTSFVFEGKKIPVTISVGVATRKTNESDWSSLYKRADEALYKSKQGGRNRVTISP